MAFAEGLIEAFYVNHVVYLLPVEHLHRRAVFANGYLYGVPMPPHVLYHGHEGGGALLWLYAEPLLCAVFGIKAQKPLLRAGLRRKLYIQHGEEYGQYYEQPAQYGCGYFERAHISSFVSTNF